ncbi:MAG: hypothetical protein ABI120_16220 [Gemmatimonadaceae bacterium]
MTWYSSVTPWRITRRLSEKWTCRDSITTRCAWGQTINPPESFVRETLAYLYEIGKNIEATIRTRIFSLLLPTLAPDWSSTHREPLLELFELFSYSGYLETAKFHSWHADPMYTNEQREAEMVRIKHVLICRCLDDLKAQFTP